MTVSVMATFIDNEQTKEEFRTENKLVFLGLFCAEVPHIRVENVDGSKVRFVYFKEDAKEPADIIMANLINSPISMKDPSSFMVPLGRIILGWNVWEHFLNQLRDENRNQRLQKQKFE